MNIWRGLPALLAAMVVAWGAQAGTVPVLSGLTPIPLKAGINLVPQFTADGRDATILLGWRDNGNAHGYDLFVVTLPSRPGGNDTQIVGVDADGGFADSVSDRPHAGEDMVRAVRFARGRVDGQPATLLLTATRAITGTYYDPAPVDFVAYRLRRAEGGPGTTPDYFASIAKFRSPTPYCNAEIALATAFNLPLRAGYEGAKGRDGKPVPDGCFH